MTETQYSELKSRAMTCNSLAQLLEMERRTVRKYLDAAEVPEVGRTANNGILYPLAESLRVLLAASRKANSMDRRNEAQARKAEVETQILLRKYLPIDEIMEPLQLLLSNFTTVVKGSDLKEEDKEALIAKAKKAIPTEI